MSISAQSHLVPRFSLMENPKELHLFQKDDLLKVSLNAIDVTEKGRLFIRNIAMVFDSYLTTSNTRFSKTV